MSNVIRIQDVDLVVKEHEYQRVITFKEMDELHQRKSGSAKRNFMNHREKFVPGEDYYMIPLKEFREKFTPNSGPQKGNPNLDIILLTEMGYLMLVKTFSDALAWSVQRALVNTYFRTKQATTQVVSHNESQIVPQNEFDILRSVINMIEENKRQVEETKKVLTLVEKNTQQAISKIDERIDLIASQVQQVSDVSNVSLIKASDIAHQLSLYSVTNLPHNRMVGAIAKKLGYKTNIKNNYQDDYISIVKEGENGRFSWQVYYTPKGADKIIEWFHKNKNDIYYESHFKTNSKKNKAGDLRERGYKVGGVSWAISL